jgi:hypothetical protein
MGRAAVRLTAGFLVMLTSVAVAQQPRGGFPGGPPGGGGPSGRGPSAAGGGGPDAALATSSEWGGAGGVYTCEQWRQYLERMFRMADKRRRGFIDAQDFEVIPRLSPVFHGATFDYFDMAGKGRVTRQEFVAFQSPFFAHYDKRKTCRVFQEELAKAQSPGGGQSKEAPTSYGSGFPGNAGRGAGGGGGFGGGYGGMGR